MRPVAPLDLKKLVPADLTGQAGPDFDLVAPADLWVDEAYQRDLSPKSRDLIRRIVERWNWSKFKPPVCARVDGKLHVLDGQHTAIAAATHGGITILPVVVVAAPDLADRARAFVSHAVDRLATTPGQVWHAAVVAGDEDAVTIAQVCERAGVDLVQFAPERSSYKPGQTIAMASIRRLVNRRGAMRARQVLEACAKAELAPIAADHIKVAESLLCEVDYRDEFDVERVTAALRSMGPNLYMAARELAIAKQLPMWRALTAVVYKNRRGKAKAGQTFNVPDGNVGPAAPAETPLAGEKSFRPSPMRRVIDRREPGPVYLGEPGPGRSALDQRLAEGARS